jgi:hypothetical protein
VTVLITTRQESEGPVVRVDGRLDGEGVPELERVVASLPASLRLELPDLRSADEAGLAALRALRDRGIRLTGVSEYLRLRLEVNG